MIGRVLILVCCVGVALAISPATLNLTPTNGLRISVLDEPGVTLVAVHYSVNRPLTGVAAGQYNADIPVKTGDRWVHENLQVHLSPGDTVHYWLYMLKSGRGQQLLGQSWTVPSASRTTSRPAHPARTYATRTQRPSLIQKLSPTQTRSPIHRPPIQPSIADPSGCSAFPCEIFREEFDYLDLGRWQHEITAGGGGNWEFQYYTNNRSNSYVRDGTLFIKPTLTSDTFGEAFLSSGTLDLWAGCTSNAFYGCLRQGNGVHYINPIQSARLRTINSFSFRYGRLEAEAKMPTGDWIWPAIWMLPTDSAYGGWPASGEIDLVETRGNRNLRDAQGHSIGIDTVASTLHFGPYYPEDPYEKAHVTRTAQSGTFGDNFHKYAVEWDEQSIRFYLDNTLLKTMDPGPKGFWGLGGFPHVNNPWAGRGKIAPFDQKFHIILNVAVGGTGGYFPDGAQNAGYPKPWNDKSETAMRDFWNAKSKWYPTWTPHEKNGEAAAMQIKYIRVLKLKPDP